MNYTAIKDQLWKIQQTEFSCLCISLPVTCLTVWTMNHVVTVNEIFQLF